MVARVAAALAAAGVAPVTAIGGDGPALAALGLAVRPDTRPGEGPLGGILTALEATGARVLVVAACDLPRLDAAAVRAVLDGLAARPDAAVAVAVTDRVEPLLSAWRVEVARPVVAAVFGAGDRAVHVALDRLVTVAVPVEPGGLRNVNRPGDLPG